jgi:hypothetical protein
MWEYGIQAQAKYIAGAWHTPAGCWPLHLVHPALATAVLLLLPLTVLELLLALLF